MFFPNCFSSKKIQTETNSKTLTSPSSRMHKAPQADTIPQTDQIIKDNPTEPDDDSTLPGDINIPEPIIPAIL